MGFLGFFFFNFRHYLSEVQSLPFFSVLCMKPAIFSLEVSGIFSLAPGFWNFKRKYLGKIYCLSLGWILRKPSFLTYFLNDFPSKFLCYLSEFLLLAAGEGGQFLDWCWFPALIFLSLLSYFLPFCLTVLLSWRLPPTLFGKSISNEILIFVTMFLICKKFCTNILSSSF